MENSTEQEIEETVERLESLKQNLENYELEKHQELDLDERVMFFPSRREIVVDQPQENTRSVLSKSAHLVDSTGESYLYKISPEDIWNTPYETFQKLRDDLKLIVGKVWNGGFESRIRDDWDRAHMFRLRTDTGDSGNKFSVLIAEDKDAFENVAKRKLEHNRHYTKFLSDTKMRIKSGGEAEVKETLYDEGYPVIDERELDDGESLTIDLTEGIELRDYQYNWVEHFAERKAGVFVGPSGSGKTVAAIGAMSEIGGETLILAPSRELVQQWEDELVEKTGPSKSSVDLRGR